MSSVKFNYERTNYQKWIRSNILHMGKCVQKFSKGRFTLKGKIKW